MEPDGGLDPLLLGRRAAVLDKYEGLKTTYPELPSNLCDYQVSCSHLACVRRIYFTLTLTFYADVVAELLSGEKSHVLSCFPTGSGKSLPMLVAALLMPPGKQIVCLPLSF